MHTHRRPARRRAFSLVEMLVALTICAMLLTATLSALDASWRGYKMTTESASTHVVSRIVVHRVLAMVRTGSDFGPFPADPSDPTQNPITSNSMEFVSEDDRLNNIDRITRLERRNSTISGMFELWYVKLNSTGQITEERPLMKHVRNVSFTLEYDDAPRLRKATVDLTVASSDEGMKIGIGSDAPPIRLIASASPRGVDGE